MDTNVRIEHKVKDDKLWTGGGGGVGVVSLSGRGHPRGGPVSKDAEAE